MGGKVPKVVEKANIMNVNAMKLQYRRKWKRRARTKLLKDESDVPYKKGKRVNDIKEVENTMGGRGLKIRK